MAKRVKAVPVVEPVEPPTAAWLASQAPDGWTVTTGVGLVDIYGDVFQPQEFGQPDPCEWVKFDRVEDDGALKVTIALNVKTYDDEWTRKYGWRGRTVEGHTLYNGRTFTRRGIDVESCKLTDGEKYDHNYDDLCALLAGELARCRDAFEHGKTMVSVPGLPGGFRVSPETKTKIAAKLQAGKTHSFYPHGFGTGYTVGPRRFRRASPQLPRETSEFFGVVGPLYYETMDCD